MPLKTNAPQKGFSDTEFIDRTAKAQALMATDDLAGLLLMSEEDIRYFTCLLYTSPSPRDGLLSRMPSSA